MDSQLQSRLSELIQSEPVFLFMKGNPTFPQCGFSNQVVQILKGFNVPFGHFDVLSDYDLREAIKLFSDWPTIPQLYVRGEFVGGCDIVRESWESGELEDLLKEAFPDREIAAPMPPVKPKNIQPTEAKTMLVEGGARFLDVRTDEERGIVAVDGFEQLDQAAAESILKSEDKNKPLVFMCHFGGRSAQAAEYFANQGFQKVFNVLGGIDAWAQTVDSELNRY